MATLDPFEKKLMISMKSQVKHENGLFFKKIGSETKTDFSSKPESRIRAFPYYIYISLLLVIVVIIVIYRELLSFLETGEKQIHNKVEKP